MRLIHTSDRAQQAAALHTIHELIDGGFAGLDCYDHQIFVVDAPTREQHDHADVALDLLGASFRQVGPFGGHASRLECHLPTWVRAELGLDRQGAPELIVPLASRAVTRRRDQLRSLDPTAPELMLTEAATLDVLIDDIRNGARV